MTKDIVADEQAQTITCHYDSSAVSRTVYHYRSQHLEVEYQRRGSARWVTYFPVPEALHQRLMLAESIGTTVTEALKAPGIRFESGDREAFERQQKKKRGY